MDVEGERNQHYLCKHAVLKLEEKLVEERAQRQMVNKQLA